MHGYLIGFIPSELYEKAMNNIYNERLFKGGVRAWLHIARFRWLREKCIGYQINCDFVIEIGCFDGRSIEYLSGTPKEYYGFDAGWDGGLDLAQVKYADKGWCFLKTTRAEDIYLPADRIASLAISLETLEHIAPELIEKYLNKISSILDGYFLVTVPNEKGIVFLLKYLAKLFFFGGKNKYRISEVCFATFGLMHLVDRSEHKGFDWKRMLGQLSQHFDVIEVAGVHFPILPAALNPQIGFVLATKNYTR